MAPSRQGTPISTTTAVALSRPPTSSACATSRSAASRQFGRASIVRKLPVVELAVHSVGAEQEPVAGAHRDRQHIDTERLVLEADEGGEPVHGHAAITVLADVQTGRQQFGPHVVIVGQDVEARPAPEVGQAIGPGVADVDHRHQRPADDGGEQRGPEPLDAAFAGRPGSRRR